MAPPPPQAPDRPGVPTDETLTLGAHLLSERPGYMHHGIYAGHGQVLHYAGFKGFLRRGPVEKTSLAAFAGGYPVRVRPSPGARYGGAQAVCRAGSRLGEDNYRLLSNNCEHFCAWCLHGEPRSEQVAACLRNPVRALRTVCSLFAILLASEWRNARASLAQA